MSRFNRPRKFLRFLPLLLLAPLVALVTTGTANAAATAVPLGTTTTFAVLGGSTVTNTGTSVITGDLGLSPGTSISGFPPGVLNGTVHATDAVATQAQADLVTAYNSAAAEAPTATVSADLGGQRLTPGVYHSASTLGLTGALTLDAGGNPNAVFVFQAETSTLTTASASAVNLVNGAQACNVFWQVGSSATLGTDSSFVGTIIAAQSITVTTSVTILGRVLAQNGAVTLDTDTITTPTCAATTATTTPTAGSGAAAGSSGAGSTTASTVPPVKKTVRKGVNGLAGSSTTKKPAAKTPVTTTPATPPTTVPPAPKGPLGNLTIDVTG
jgi:hypothetical protein